MFHLCEKVEGIRCGGEGKEEMGEVDQPGEVEGEGGRFDLGGSSRKRPFNENKGNMILLEV